MFGDKEKVQRLLSSGGELAAAAVGGALGFFAGGPVTAAGTAALGVALTKGTQALLTDFANRHLSHREEMRVGAVAALAIDGIQKRLEKGQQLRNDGFFSLLSSGRSKAEEIFEGVLQKSKNEHEEKKLQYYAHIFINAPFDEKLTSETMNHILSVADGLTYRQMCLLTLFSRPQPFMLRDHDYYGPPQANDKITNVRVESPNETANVLAEIFELCQQSLVRCYKPGSKSARERIPILGLSDIRPSWMVRISFGDRLYELMQLDSIPYDDLKTVTESILD
ncbi:hypothetical protein IIA28_21125 [candidate division KSB1 bacterium]|nr:hypothetical protein [candidate division KSB1 bacterium]